MHMILATELVILVTAGFLAGIRYLENRGVWHHA